MAASNRCASACCSLHWAERRAHLLLEGFAVVLHRLRAYVAAGGEDVTVLANFVQGRINIRLTPSIDAVDDWIFSNRITGMRSCTGSTTL